jgi:hypothetical protein
MRPQPRAQLVGSVPAAVALGIFIGLGLLYAGQPPLERHAFRQTQTALTAYWFLRDGFSLAYLTPVGGPPWRIPFELPLYQALVALLSGATGLSVAAAGRLTSLAFLLACLPPMATIVLRLGLSELVFHAFVAIALSSPLYLFWGRSVMIETTALWLAVMTLWAWIVAEDEGWTPVRWAGFTVFATLAMLQKVTTALPVLLVLVVVHGLHELGRLRRRNVAPAVLMRRLGWVALAFATPLAATAAWVVWTDAVKAASELGRGLTSAQLAEWNWGTLAQRLSTPLWRDVLWTRLFVENLGGLGGLVLLLAAVLAHDAARVRRIVLVTIALGIVPLLMFPNLHLVHDYYQSANALFLMFGVAVGLGAIVAPRIGLAATGALLATVVSVNLYGSITVAVQWMRNDMFLDSRDEMVASVIRRETSPEARFVASGHGWSSTFVFLSERRGRMVGGEVHPLVDPAGAVEAGTLGAVVDCRPASGKPASRLLDWAASQTPRWKVGDVADCAVAVPARDMPAFPERPARCSFALEATVIRDRVGSRLVRVSGWSTTTDARRQEPDAVFVELRGGSGSPLALEALMFRDVVTNGLNDVPNEAFASFSALTHGNVLPAGDYDATVLLVRGQRSEACATRVSVPEAPAQGRRREYWLLGGPVRGAGHVVSALSPSWSGGPCSGSSDTSRDGPVWTCAG